jgi:hypothetical protein
MSRHVSAYLAAISMAFVLSGSLSAEGQSIRDFWSRNPRLRIAPFHVLFLYSFAETQAKSTKDSLEDLLRTFNSDVFDLSGNDPKLENLRVADIDMAHVESLDDFKKQLEHLKIQLRKDLSADPSNPPIVLIYLLVHGEQDGNVVKVAFGEGAAKTYPSREELARDVHDVAENGRLARLVVFVSDNCSPQVASTAGPAKVLSSGRGVWRSLYFGHSGLVDIFTSASNEYAFITSQGSLFLIALNNALDPASKLSNVLQLSRSDARDQFVKALDVDPPLDDTVSWNEFKQHFAKVMIKSVGQFKGRLGTAEPTLQLLQAQDGVQSVTIDVTKARLLEPRQK